MIKIIVAIACLVLAGCARNPYYSGTAAQHMVESIPCDQDSCGQNP